ncbi:MAG: hypothetical protein MJK04_29935, partial [Psychrosphaera sp.]|nr:hypothetical protein [Psychrosphaera sp.]
YDIAGNITQMNGDVFAYSTDKQHQLTAICSSNVPVNKCHPSNTQVESAWFYDETGNLIKKAKKEGAKWQYDFNARNQLVSVINNNRTVASFVYGPFGRRIQKLAEDLTGTTYISSFYDIEKKPGNEVVSTIYVQGPQGVVASYQSSSKSLDVVKSRYFHQNHIGSSTLITDATGAEASRTVYEPYGEPNESESSGEQSFRQKFTGKELDSNSGLYYFGARYYDASIGRFISPDPALQTASPYLYAGNDPITNTDPSGLWFGSSILHNVENAAKSGFDDVENTAKGLYALGKEVVKDGGFESFIAHRLYDDISHTHSVGGFFAGLGKSTANLAIGIANLSLDLQMVPEAILLGSSTPQIPTFQISKNEQFGADIAIVASFAIPGVGEEEAAEEGLELGAKAAQDAEAGEADSCAMSFAQGTQVLIKDGVKNIEDVEVGDEVWAYNEQTGDNELNVATRLLTRQAPDTVIIEVNGEKITTTRLHPFYTDGKWVAAQDLAVGDRLNAFNRPDVYVTNSAYENGHEQVFNFVVEDQHNYFVSRHKVLVKNPPCTRSAQRKRNRSEISPDNIQRPGAKRIRWATAPPGSSSDGNLLRPGPNARESIGARSTSQSFTASENASIDRFGARNGCHSCSIRESGYDDPTHYTPDHQPPSGILKILNDGVEPPPNSQRLYPHCKTCSITQGGQVSRAIGFFNRTGELPAWAAK